MINQMLFSLRYGNKAYYAWAIVALKLVMLLSVFRFGLYFLFVAQATMETTWMETILSFVTGIRFDVLILGFIFIPVTLFLLLQSLFLCWPRFGFQIYKLYFALIWISICLLNWIDFPFFVNGGQRTRYEQYNHFAGMTWWESFQLFSEGRGIIFFLIVMVGFVWGLFIILRHRETSAQIADSQKSRWPVGLEFAFRILAPLLLTALAGRGSLARTHLGLEHSRISQSLILNEMALNPMWCFDK